MHQKLKIFTCEQCDVNIGQVRMGPYFGLFNKIKEFQWLLNSVTQQVKLVTGENMLKMHDKTKHEKSIDIQM